MKYITASLFWLLFSSQVFAISPLHQQFLGTWEGKEKDPSNGDATLVHAWTIAEDGYKWCSKDRTGKNKLFKSYKVISDHADKIKKFDLIKDYPPNRIIFCSYYEFMGAEKKLCYLAVQLKEKDSIEIVHLDDNANLKEIYKLKKVAAPITCEPL